MTSRSRTFATIVVLLVVLLIAIVGARLIGQHSTDGAAAEKAEKERAAGVVNRLSIANMLDVPVRLSIGDVDLAQWGRTPPDDEPPAGLEAEVIDAHRVSNEVGLRPLRIEDGGGDATFTISLLTDLAGRGGERLARIPARSTTLEYCSVECFDGYGYFDWADAPEPQLDVFRQCVVDDRVIGSYVDASGVVRELHAAFQCDATRFQSVLVLHD